MRVTPEHLLVERCRQGDETAFRELVDQYKGLVFGLIARSISNRARAEELAQDVFLKVHKGLPYFRGESKLSTWIYRIVINVVSQERPELASVSLDDDDDDRPRREPGSEDRAFGDIAIKGLRYEDLAEALNMPMGTVKTHLHRAKRRLRHLLETELR
jgi:RNA polymerase sigma-70 factor (ECF subfamily)